ncbi:MULTISPECIES: asparagine synthase (glutamine-hydrolyzing) [unclassified Amycolatopsis]|uniref:asparagine synthase (glutamine-hydrolyzing) n=1 Tax=unclassified Amycolatopsis TaxID=2618356 RepID=UPI002E13B551|nr:MULTISPECIES: asparagine synthase (glutamine-hydrolyzing) [unclassified Amycolatopsis]WSJ79503.1 asparagine synthase (glutamine-hydrolyzing) [Amycolatopsis sp. NBC_01307]WSK77012.1 asparagine synthase (glutamine-hydrolyzing) [Amycolatopsis sp. NBC_01286]
MCGIVAWYAPSSEAITSDVVATGRAMLTRLAHRGPDDTGQARVGEHVWLGHNRLSIVGPANGRQPLGEAGPWSLVCNGEIYNDAELRESLPGHHFTTASDSESALALLTAEGPRALDRLEGMWALCAATPDGRFVAARDRLGIKPLYWARTGGRYYFASEMRAFPVTVQHAVEMFPPGCWWTPEDGLVRFATAVTFAPVQDGLTAVELESRTRAVLVDSVRRHLMADVEVGVFLSGGLDSSIVAAVAAAEYAREGRRLKTFAVGVEGSSDLLAAREVAEFLGTEHRETVFDAAQAVAALDDVVASVESFDAGLIRSAVPNWFLAELAAQHVKAVLTGEGADELFAGYSYYHERHRDPAALHRELRRTIEQLHGLNLQRCDRVTMAHGLEARVPFLDTRVVDHAMSLPDNVKSLEADGLEKGHLRRAFTGWLPERLLWRPKLEFGTGSGAADLLTPYWNRHIGDAELTERRDPATSLRSKEELAYYRAFRRALPEVRPAAVLTRFAVA